MIAELWAGHGGLMYLRMSNQYAFTQYPPSALGQITIPHLDAIRETKTLICLVRDGKWTGNMIKDD